MQGRTESCSRFQGIMDDTQRFEIHRRVLSTHWLSHHDPTKDSAIKAGQSSVNRDGQHTPDLNDQRVGVVPGIASQQGSIFVH